MELDKKIQPIASRIDQIKKTTETARQMDTIQQGNPNVTQEGTFSRQTGKIETYAPGLNPVTEANAISNVRRGTDITKGLTIAAKGLGDIVLGAQETINPELYKNIPIEDRRALAEGVGKATPIAVGTVLTGGTTAPELLANLGLGMILGVTEQDPLYNIVGNGVFKLFGKFGQGLAKGSEKAGKYLDRPETPVFIGGMTQYIEFDEVISKSTTKQFGVLPKVKVK